MQAMAPLTPAPRAIAQEPVDGAQSGRGRRRLNGYMLGERVTGPPRSRLRNSSPRGGLAVRAAVA
jgi:hypothetical protein